MNYWMIVERAENHEIDTANKFAFFGLPNRYRKLASSIEKGDLVFCYVSSGRSAFADIREVQETGLKRLKVQSYDAAFAYYFSTKPILVLPRDKWLSIKDVATELELTRDRKDYRPILQTSIRMLTKHDADLLQKRLSERLQPV
jgi:hypothetical protein